MEFLCRDFQSFWSFYSLNLVAERLLSHLSNYRFRAIAGTDCQVKSEALQLIPAVPYLPNKSKKEGAAMLEVGRFCLGYWRECTVRLLFLGGGRSCRCLITGGHRVTKRMNRCSSASFRTLHGDESKKIQTQGGGGFRELFRNSGDLGEVSGFPLDTCGPAHHLCTRPRCPSLFLSPKPPLTS